MTLHCANGCHRINSDGDKEPVLAKVGRLCTHCADRLEEWLREIPERYALVPDYVLPSVDLDANPESQAVKRITAPVPLRLGAVDLLDTRLGRKWQGTEPTLDRRGALGTLLAIGNELRETRGSNPKTNSYVMTEADHLRLSIEALAKLESISYICLEIRTLHRQLGYAVGQYPPRPVGVCTLIVDNDEGEPEACGGPLMPIETGVRCPRCGAKWGHLELRRLGLVLGDTA